MIKSRSNCCLSFTRERGSIYRRGKTESSRADGSYFGCFVAKRSTSSSSERAKRAQRRSFKNRRNTAYGLASLLCRFALLCVCGSWREFILQEAAANHLSSLGWWYMDVTFSCTQRPLPIPIVPTCASFRLFQSTMPAGGGNCGSHETGRWTSWVVLRGNDVVILDVCTALSLPP